MANVVLTPQTATRDGVEPVFTTLNAVDVYFFRNTESTILYVKNDAAGTANVTLVTPLTVAGLAVEDQLVVISTGLEAVVAATPLSAFNDSTGSTSFTQDQATGVSAAVLNV